jgi:GLPGLI family protein
MRKTIAFICLAFLPALLFAQKGNVKVAGKIYYVTSHLYDTIAGAVFTENSLLVFGEGESLFRSYDYLLGYEATKKKTAAGQSSFGGMVMTKGTSAKYYTNTNTKELTRVQTNGVVSVSFAAQQYVMPEKIEKIDWKITKETKKIGGYICQKATGVCKGRAYTAWFAADIPYSFGPWKLNGLPGLIMEAEDSRKQVLFTFSKIEFPVDGVEYVEPVANAVITTEKEFERMREGPVNSSAAAHPGITVTATGKDAQGKPLVAKGVTLMNNPMDMVSRLPRLFMQ